MQNMSTNDRIANKVQDAKGKVKEAAGKATDDHELQAKGKADQVKSAVKDAGERVEHAVDDAASRISHAVKR
jgi:uncharacterized protein YjbJ (UPF0337 family)